MGVGPGSSSLLVHSKFSELIREEFLRGRPVPSHLTKLLSKVTTFGPLDSQTQGLWGVGWLESLIDIRVRSVNLGVSGKGSNILSLFIVETN